MYTEMHLEVSIVSVDLDGMEGEDGKQVEKVRYIYCHLFINNICVTNPRTCAKGLGTPSDDKLRA